MSWDSLVFQSPATSHTQALWPIGLPRGQRRINRQSVSTEKLRLLTTIFKMTADDIRQRIWAIPDGVPLKLDHMTIQTTDSNKLLVTGWTNTIHFQMSRPEIGLHELTCKQYGKNYY